MYPQKVLQGIPNLKRTIKIGIFNLLIMAQADSQHIRHLLLRQALILAGLLQVFPHGDDPLFYVIIAWEGCVKMLRLNRDSRRLLDLIIATPPMLQGVAYDFCQMQELSGLPYLEYKETVTYLAQLGAIDLDPRMNYYRLTTVGRHYREFSGIEFREFLLKSIVVPILVAFVTTLATNLLKLL